MASVMQIKGTTFDSFFIGKKGPTIAKSGSLDLTLNAVDSTTGIVGGAISITAGANTTASGGGGAISVTGGAASTTTGTGGALTLSGGAGNVGSTSSNGGNVNILGGTGGGNGGTISLQSGSGVTNAGNISVVASNASGAGSTGGAITISTGNGVSAGGDITISPGTHTGAGTAGAIIIDPAGTGVGETTELQLKELVANGTNYVGLKAPDSLAGNQVWTLPVADGTVGQVISTDGAGNFGFSTAWSGQFSISALPLGTVLDTINDHVPFYDASTSTDTKVDIDTLRGFTIAQLTGSDTNLSEPMMFMQDAVRVKNLSVETSMFTFSRPNVNASTWLKVGTAGNGKTGFIMPYNGTIIRMVMHCANALGFTRNFDIYVDAVSNPSVATITGGTNAVDTNTAINIDFLAGQKLRVFGNTGSTIKATVAVIWVKWRN